MILCFSLKLYNSNSMYTTTYHSALPTPGHHLLTNRNYARNFYCNRLPRIWSQLPCIDINQSLPAIEATIHKYLWQHFITNFFICMIMTSIMLIISAADVANVTILDLQSISPPKCMTLMLN